MDTYGYIHISMKLNIEKDLMKSFLPYHGNYNMAKSIKSHFYIVKGTPKDKLFPTVGWMIHSYKELEEFALFAIDLIPEYDLDIQETNFNESEIIEKWSIK